MSKIFKNKFQRCYGKISILLFTSKLFYELFTNEIMLNIKKFDLFMKNKIYDLIKDKSQNCVIKKKE